MAQMQNRAQQARSEELPEFNITGPFGGIQTELPLTEIENLGFGDVLNILFRKGAAYVRPGFSALANFPDPPGQGPILGIADLFTTTALRIQSVLTQTALLKWNPPTSDWTEITGSGFNGTPTQLWSWTVVNNRLCFSQGADPVFLWDGIAASYSTASIDAVAANYLMELNTHLIVADVFDGVNRFTQRVQWTAAGDPTDWTGFNAGTNDLLNDLGPINGLVKLFQTGYAMHQWGITQIIPTGVGTAPFRFVPLTSKPRGNICPHSLASFGEEAAVYVGKDNVYLFDGSSSVPIGDRPLEGRKKVGARSAIFADLTVSDPRRVYGFVTTTIAGHIFNAYWLDIPNVSVWVFNFDEGNWTRFGYDGVLTSLGLFYKAGVIRIMDLIGLIRDQNWSPATLVPTTPFDGFALGFEDGTVGYVDFTNYSEKPWFITSGKHIFNDRRHSHTVKNFRLVVSDQGAVSYTITVSNNLGQSQTQVVTIGTGSGDVISRIIPFNVSGLRITWKVSGDANAPGAMVEFSLIHDIGGEQRGGTVDG